jgi:hypothetical protein
MAGFKRFFNPRNPTHKPIQKVLPKIFKNMNRVYKVEGQDVVAAFIEVIGDKWASMCQVQNFIHDILYVKVHHATLYSILVQENRDELLNKLRRKVPTVKINKIVLRR